MADSSISGPLGTSHSVFRMQIEQFKFIHSNSCFVEKYVIFIHCERRQESPVCQPQASMQIGSDSVHMIIIMQIMRIQDILSHCLTMRMLDSNVLLIELTDISVAYP